MIISVPGKHTLNPSCRTVPHPEGTWPRRTTARISAEAAKPPRSARVFAQDGN